MKKPFFTIITCTLNSAKYIDRNIESVIGQTFKNWEQIFVDGYSEDRTIQKINTYKNGLQSKIRLYKSKPLGISNAMNFGIDKSRGEYIFILHSDDSFFDPNVLQNVYDYLSVRKFPDWIYGKIMVIEETGKQIGIFPERTIYRFIPNYFLKFYNIIPHQSVFMKKSVFNKYGNFDESLSSLMDFDMWLRIIDKTKPKFFNRIIANYTIRKGAQSSDKSNKFENNANFNRVAKSHMNLIEYYFFLLVKRFLDRYNKTSR